MADDPQLPDDHEQPAVDVRLIGSEPSDRDQMVKAALMGAPGEVDRSNVKHSGDVVRKFQQSGSIIPPYDPSLLIKVYEHSNSLRQNIDAYITNIDAHGHRFEPVLQLESDEIGEEVRVAMMEEKRFEGEEDPKEPPDDEVKERLESIHREMKIELSRINFFFKFAAQDQSFIQLRRKTRQDLEITGNAYWEVLRNKRDEISEFVLVPAHTVRLMPLSPESMEVEVPVMPTSITYGKRTSHRRFRKLVQVFQGQLSWFKEFGHPMVVSAVTGNEYLTEEEFRAEEPESPEANEILHFRIHSGRSPYGVPRWIGALLAVLGSRQAEEVNILYFENKSVPPLAILVSGGRVTEETVKRIESFVENEIKGKRNFHKILVLEAEGPLTQGGTEHTGRMKIEMRPLTSSINNDALFQNYDKENIGKVGQSFRIPPLLRGDSRDFNRATAQAVLKFTETQVFAPERQEFDDVINRKVVADLEICYYRFVSNSPKTTDPEEQAKVLERLTKVGAIVPEEARAMAEEILNRELKRIQQPWVRIPFALSLAGRFEETVLLADKLRGMGMPGFDFPGLSAGDDNKEDGDKPDPLKAVEDLVAGAGDGEEEPKVAADVGTGSLDSGGGLLPAQGAPRSGRKPSHEDDKNLTRLPAAATGPVTKAALPPGALTGLNDALDRLKTFTAKIEGSGLLTQKPVLAPVPTGTEDED